MEGLDKLTLKFICKNKDPQVSQTLKKKSKERALASSDMKTYKKGIIINSVVKFKNTQTKGIEEEKVQT